MLDEFIDDNNIRTRIDSVRLEQEWSDIVDEPLASNINVASYNDGFLLLLASDPSWSQEATYQKETIRRTINEYFDRELVESIRVKNR